MAFSGSTTFNATALQICTRAEAKIKQIDTSNNEVMPTSDYTDFLFQLNLITKRTMATKGVLPWVRAYNLLILQQGQTTYSLGPGSSDHWAVASSVTSTTLSIAAAQGATSITVVTATGMSSGQQIGIVLASGLTFWTTINGAPVGNVVTLTSALTGGANLAAQVWVYTTTADRPQRILNMTRNLLTVNGQLQTIPMTPISLQEYMQLPNKQQLGTPLQYNFANKIANAELVIWQPYDGIGGWNTCTALCDTIIEDFVNTTDNPYFPVEWVDYLIFQLAFEMSFEYPVSKADRDDLKTVAAQFLDELLDYSSTLAEDSLHFGMRFVNKQ